MNYLPITDTEADLIRAALENFAGQSTAEEVTIQHPAAALASEIDARCTRTRGERWELHRALGSPDGEPMHFAPTIPECVERATEIRDARTVALDALRNISGRYDQLAADVATVRRLFCPDMATAEPVNLANASPVVEAEIVDPLDDLTDAERSTIATVCEMVLDAEVIGDGRTEDAVRDLLRRLSPPPAPDAVIVGHTHPHASRGVGVLAGDLLAGHVISSGTFPHLWMVSNIAAHPDKPGWVVVDLDALGESGVCSITNEYDALDTITVRGSFSPT